MKKTLCPSLLIALLSLFFTGCESDSGGSGASSQRSATPLGTAPQAVPSANVDRIQAYQDASMIASRKDGRTALVGGGTSMNPIYGDNTMLVVQPVEYENLKAGMTVVYLGKHGRRVAHVLIAKEAKGWRAQGINNPEEDKDLVTPDNLIGIVYASMVSEAK